MRPDIANYFRRLDEIPGWFSPVDFLLFDSLLTTQPVGDLLEIGAYQGASAILLGMHRRPDEAFTVCDLFGMPEETAANRAESEFWYSDLTRTAFEHNYLRFVSELPTIIQAPSDEILQHVNADSCRFVHVDGSHLYEYVQSDIRAAKLMLRPEGIIVCDDWRSPHTPGVTVAVMDQVLAGDLHVIALTNQKFYGSWSESAAKAAREDVISWARTTPEVQLHLEVVRGVRWPRIVAAAGRRFTLRERAARRAGRGLAKLRRDLHTLRRRAAARK